MIYYDIIQWEIKEVTVAVISDLTHFIGPFETIKRKNIKIETTSSNKLNTDLLQLISFKTSRPFYIQQRHINCIKRFCRCSTQVKVG